MQLKSTSKSGGQAAASTFPNRCRECFHCTVSMLLRANSLTFGSQADSNGKDFGSKAGINPERKLAAN
jgi:hypothetical protein